MKKYLFTSERLGFRLWESTDLASFVKLNSDKEVMRYFPLEYWADEKETLKYITSWNIHYEKYGFTYYAVDLLKENQFIGFIGCKEVNFNLEDQKLFDIGWRLDKKFWGKGLATEGAIAVRDHFFASTMENRLVSIAPKLNIPSLHVMEKIGMKLERSFQHPMISEDSPLRECVLYAIRRNEI